MLFQKPVLYAGLPKFQVLICHDDPPTNKSLIERIGGFGRCQLYISE